MADENDRPGKKGARGSLEMGPVYDIPVQVATVLGSSKIQVSQLLKLSRGAVMELDRRVDDPVDIYVNKQLVARGTLIQVDEHLGVTITEIVGRGIAKASEGEGGEIADLMVRGQEEGPISSPAETAVAGDEAGEGDEGGEEPPTRED